MWCSDPSFLSCFTLFMDCCRGNDNAKIHHTVSFIVHVERYGRMKRWDKGGLIISTVDCSHRFEFGCTVAFLMCFISCFAFAGGGWVFFC